MKSYTSRCFCVLHAFIVQFFNQSIQRKGDIRGGRNDISDELSVAINDSLKWDHNEYNDVIAW